MSSLRVFSPFVRPVALTAALGLLFWQADPWGSFLEPGPRELARKIVLSLLTLSAGWLFTVVVDVFFWRAVVQRRTGREPSKLLVAMLRVVVISLALAIVFNRIFQQPLTALLFSSGVIGIVLGFALRGIISDFFSGLALNVEGPFRLGDWIKVGDDPTGRVVEMNWRSTHLVTLDEILVVLPNSLVAERGFHNYDRPRSRFRTEIPIALEYGVRIPDAKRVLLAGIRSVPKVLGTPEPDVLVKEFGDDGVIYRMRFWVQHYTDLQAVRDAVATSVSDQLWHAGMDVPFPKRDVFMARMPPRQLDRQKDRATLIGRVDLFASLDSAAISRLADCVIERRYGPGVDVVQQDDGGTSLFLVVDGLLDVAVKDEKATRVVAQVLPGQFFGEQSLLTGDPRSATVTTETEATLYEVRREDLAPMLQERPELAESLSRALAERRRRNDEALSREANVESRVVRSTLAEQFLKRIHQVFHIGNIRRE